MTLPAFDVLELLSQTADGRLNQDSGGHLVDWALSANALRTLASELRPETVSAETGCGMSTLLLGAAGRQHHCFTLLEEECTRIVDTAGVLGLALDNVHFHIGDSSVTLPSAELPELDVVLVDGAHAFPYPVTDWFFLTRSLRAGGLLGVDDSWIPSVQMLEVFIDKQAGWQRLSADGRTTWYRRTDAAPGPSEYPDGWDAQGINRRVAQQFAAKRAMAQQSTREQILGHPLLWGRRTVGGMVVRRRPPPHSPRGT